jgi:hypothetical protein
MMQFLDEPCVSGDDGFYFPFDFTSHAPDDFGNEFFFSAVVFVKGFLANAEFGDKVFHRGMSEAAFQELAPAKGEDFGFRGIFSIHFGADRNVSRYNRLRDDDPAPMETIIVSNVSNIVFRGSEVKKKTGRFENRGKTWTFVGIWGGMER